MNAEPQDAIEEIDRRGLPREQDAIEEIDRRGLTLSVKGLGVGLPRTPPSGPSSRPARVITLDRFRHTVVEQGRWLRKGGRDRLSPAAGDVQMIGFRV